MTHRITATYAYAINATAGRVDSKPKVAFAWHDDLAAFRFLRRNVRGYRGPFHPYVSVTYAKKIQALAVDAGFEVTVKECPKPTPAQAQAAVAGFWAQLKAQDRAMTS